MSAFKTKFSIQTQTPLKSSAQKKFIENLQHQYHYVTEEIWNEIFPEKSITTLVKLSNKMALYYIKSKQDKNDSIESVPYFFDWKGNKDEPKYPTIFLLWKVPHFLPTIFIAPEVSGFLLRGADLMLPGVSWTIHQEMKDIFGERKHPVNPENDRELRYIQWMPDINRCVCNLEWLTHEALVSIQVVGNPLPLGIGVSLMDRSMILNSQRKAFSQITDLDSSDPKSAQGRLVHIYHIYKDNLWEFAGSIKPNPGFVGDKVKSIGISPIPQGSSAQISEEENPTSPLLQEGKEEEQGKKKETETEKNEIATETVATNERVEEEEEEEEEEKVKDTTTDGNIQNEISMNSTQVFEYEFLQLLLHKWYHHALPLLANDIYDELRTNLSSKGSTVNTDIKNTDYRKLGRFVKHCEEQDWIEIEEKTSQISIISIHPEAVGRYILCLKYPNFTKPMIDAFIQWCNLHCSDQPQATSQSETDQSQKLLDEWLKTDLKMENASEAIKKSLVEWFGGFESIIANGVTQAFEMALQREFTIESKGAANASDVFMEQFLATLRYGVTPEMLPINVSELCSKKYLYVKKPDFQAKEISDGTTLQNSLVTTINATTWKKLNKFMKDFCKHPKYGSLLQCKPVKKNATEYIITDIDFNLLINQSEDFDIGPPEQYWTPLQLEQVIKKLNKKSNQESDQNQSEQQNKTEPSSSNITVVIKYQANHRLSPMFGTAISELHSKSNAMTYLMSYVQHNSLVNPQDASQVRMSSELYHMLCESKVFEKWKDTLSEDIQSIQIDDWIHRKDLSKLFELHLTPYSAVIVGDESDDKARFRPGGVPKVQIFVDKRQGRKFMTHVQGLEIYKISLKKFAAYAKKAFACSVSIQDIHGGDGQEVLIQGNVMQHIPPILTDEFGLAPQFCEIVQSVNKQHKRL